MQAGPSNTGLPVSAKRIQIKNLTRKDVVVILMGQSGSGRSTFIEKATGIEGLAGHALRSKTTDILVYKLSLSGGSTICLVDTPGIDNTLRTDEETMRLISNFILYIYKRRIQMAGLFYFYPLTDQRVLKDLNHIQELVGKDFHKVVVITTMWDRIDEKLGQDREKEIFSPWINQGMAIRRFLCTRQSALDVLSSLLPEPISKRQPKQGQKNPKVQGQKTQRKNGGCCVIM